MTGALVHARASARNVFRDAWSLIVGCGMPASAASGELPFLP